MYVSRVAAFFVLTLFAAPAWAGLVENHFPGKTEATVVTEFEAGLSAFLTARLKDTGVVLRMYAPVAKNVEVHVQLTSVEGEKTVWTTLVNAGWLKEQCEYALEPFGKTYTIEIAKIPPAEVATWFSAKTRMASEVVACACWLANKGELWLANGEVANLAAHKTDLKKDVEEWLAAKNGWTLPSEGLNVVATHDLKHNEDGELLLTKEASAAWFKKLDEECKDAFKVLEKLQGSDVKSKPGNRKNSPGMRLAILQKYVDRFGKKYAGTAFMAKKGTKDLQLIADAVKADLEWLETEKYKAERKGIEKDWAGASKHYETLQRADPLDPDLLLSTAYAFHMTAKVTDGARKSEDPAAAKKAAMYYEDLILIYPTSLGYRNHAGVNWLACGEKTKAKEHHEEVVRRIDEKATAKKELTENERQNREFAEGQLKLIN
jgi:hypothetical protein